MASEQTGQDRPNSEVPWSGAEVLLVALLGWLCPYLLWSLLLGSGCLGWFYGREVVEAALKGADEDAVLMRYRLLLWVNCLAPPLQIAAALWLLRQVSATRPVQLGLTTRRLGGNALAGLIGVLVLAPGVYGIHELVMGMFRFFELSTVKHPFEQLGKQTLYPAEWALLVLAAVVAAPMWEEFLFRGVLQPWALTRPEGGLVVMALALLFAFSGRVEHFIPAWREGPLALLRELAPTLIVLALAPVFDWLSWRRPTAAGLFAVAVLFGFYHTAIWPSPLSLLWLGLGLGWLAWRSRSLVGPIVLHALFNAIACGTLVYRALSG